MVNQACDKWEDHFAHTGMSACKSFVLDVPVGFNQGSLMIVMLSSRITWQYCQTTRWPARLQSPRKRHRDTILFKWEDMSFYFSRIKLHNKLTVFLSFTVCRDRYIVEIGLVFYQTSCPLILDQLDTLSLSSTQQWLLAALYLVYQAICATFLWGQKLNPKVQSCILIKATVSPLYSCSAT